MEVVVWQWSQKYFHQRKVVRDIVECIDADGDGKISMNEFLTAFKDEIGVGPEGIVKARVWQAQKVDLGSNMKFVCKMPKISLNFNSKDSEYLIYLGTIQWDFQYLECTRLLCWDLALKIGRASCRERV